MHKKGIIFEPLFTTESLLFEEKMRTIVCVKAEQKQKPQQEEKDTWNAGKKGYHSNAEWFCHKLLENKVFRYNYLTSSVLYLIT